MEALPYYLAENIRDNYQKTCAPFSNVDLTSFNGKPVVVFYGCKIDGIDFKIDIRCTTEKYEIILWMPLFEDEKKKNDKLKNVKDFLNSKQSGLFDNFEDSPNDCDRITMSVLVNKDMNLTKLQLNP